MKLEVTFIGRKSGALGITYEITEVIEIKDDATLDEVRLSLYDKYECIQLDKRDIWFFGTNERPFA